MFNKIKDFIIARKDQPITFNESADQKLINDALSVYCAKCKMGFKSKAGAAAHIAIKHKNG